MLVCYFLIAAVTFTLEVRVHSYLNKLHQALGNSGDCCDNEAANSPGGCTDPCDNFFIFCLRDYGTTTKGPGGVNNGFVDLTNCPRSNREQTGLVEENNDNFTFAAGQPFPKSPNHRLVPNPVQLNGSNWNVSVYKKHYGLYLAYTALAQIIRDLKNKYISRRSPIVKV